MGVARLLHRQGHEIVYFDQQPKTEEIRELSSLGYSAQKPAQTDAEICIAAPGVPYQHPDLVALRARGIKTIGEVEWVYRTVKAEIIGITGTAGKTTVTRWLSETLQAAGLNAPAGGNIDPPLAAVAVAGATLVTELSSFQLERCPSLKPKIAVLLNLATDHLDRHGSVGAYHDAKRKLIANLDENDTLIYNADDAILQRWASDSRAKTWGFSLKNKAEAYLELQPSGRSHLIMHGEKLLDSKALKLSGAHHQANALAVALACAAKSLSLDQIRQGLQAFNGVAGRYSLVANLDKVKFIEDSIATRSLAVKASLEATPAPIVWIAGGADKGADLSELKPLIKEKVALFIGIGEAGPSFAKAVESLTKTVISQEAAGEAALRFACNYGLSFLRQHYLQGGTVLLAPLAASFDQFENYQQRARVFRKVVAELEATWIAS